MKKVETLYYKIGGDNKEYWALLDDLRANAEPLEAKWSGDYIKATYEKDGFIYIVWENMELGIQSEIEKYAKEEA